MEDDLKQQISLQQLDATGSLTELTTKKPNPADQEAQTLETQYALHRE